MATAKIPHVVASQSTSKTKGPKIPKTLAAAVAQGFRICEESFTGELSRRGTFKLERIDKATGDREVLLVPFSAQITTGRPRSYRIHRHAHLTPAEAEQFEASFRPRVPASTLPIRCR